MSFDDDERLRIDDQGDDDDRSQSTPPSTPIGLAVLGVTKTITSYPSAVGKMFAFTPQAVLGDESEGAAAALTALGGTQFACLTAGTVPPTGSTIIAHFVPYRFVFEY